MTTPFEAAGGWPGILGTLQAGDDLTAEQTESIFADVLAGNATDAQIAAFIVSLRSKGETVEELTGMVRAMKAAGTPLSVPANAIDIVGMGGSPSRRKAALNVSTMASFVAAGAGAVICKHGNRKASSTSGSFDLLEELGAAFEFDANHLSTVVRETGVGFAFAKLYHPSMRHVGSVRLELGIPTVFNALGPLANPAWVTRQVVGVAEDELADRMIAVLAATGSEFAWVVTGPGHLDELSTTGPSSIRQLSDGEITTFSVDPADHGIAPPAEGALDGGDAAANKAIFERLLAGETGAVRDIVALNAAAGLVVAGVATDLGDGMQRAAESIGSGAAQATLTAHVQASNAA